MSSIAALESSIISLKLGAACKVAFILDLCAVFSLCYDKIIIIIASHET